MACCQDLIVIEDYCNGFLDPSFTLPVAVQSYTMSDRENRFLKRRSVVGGAITIIDMIDELRAFYGYKNGLHIVMDDHIIVNGEEIKEFIYYFYRNA